MKKIFVIALVMVIGIEACQVPESSKSYVLKLKGSESMHETFNVLKSDFEKMQDTLKIILEGGGSRTGMMAVYDNSAQIGLSSFPFDLDSILGRQHNITERVVAYDGIVLISNEDNPVEQLTTEQVSGIFSGEITNWQQIGGAASTIQPIIRDQNSGTQQFFTNYFNIEQTAAHALIASENAEIVDSVHRNPAGIGFIGFAYFTERVRNLLLPSPIEGDTPFVAPSFKNLLAGSYPLKRSLRIYYKDTDDPAVDAFLLYLKTKRARYIMESNGLVSPPTSSIVSN